MEDRHYKEGKGHESRDTASLMLCYIFTGQPRSSGTHRTFITRCCASPLLGSELAHKTSLGQLVPRKSDTETVLLSINPGFLVLLSLW
jgi:hypothetical protein